MIVRARRPAARPGRVAPLADPEPAPLPDPELELPLPLLLADPEEPPSPDARTFPDELEPHPATAKAASESNATKVDRRMKSS